MALKQVHIYKQLFSKSFFFNKFNIDNIYQYPKIKSLKVQFIISPQLGINKLKFSKLCLFFYLIVGQRPYFLIKNYNIKSSQCNKVIGLQLTTHYNVYFFDFLIKRQFPLIISNFKCVLLTNHMLIFNVLQKIQDDDILSQALQILDSIKYQIHIQSNSLLQSHFKTLLINFKLPLKIN